MKIFFLRRNIYAEELKLEGKVFNSNKLIVNHLDKAGQSEVIKT